MKIGAISQICALCKLARFRHMQFALEREYQEYPEVTCSEQEKEEIKKQLTANIAELVSTLLAGENKNADVNGAEPDGLSIAQIMKNIPEEWNEQRKSFGFPER